MFCKECGAEVSDKAVICPKCGVKIKSKEISTGMLVTGYITSFLIPLVGIIIGIYTMTKSKPGHGIAMLILSLIFTVMWASLMA